MPNQRGFAAFLVVIIIAIIVAIVAIGFYFSLNRINRSAVTQIAGPSPSPTVYSEILQPLQSKINELELQTNPIKADEATWINSYKDLNLMTGESFTTDSVLDDDQIASASATVNDYFTSIGFTKSNPNTFSNLNDTEAVIALSSQGFVSGDTKCLITLIPSSQPGGYFFCGVINQEQADLQDQFIGVVYGPGTPNSKTPLKETEGALIEVKKVTDNFAMGQDSRFNKGIYEPSGAMWIAAKTDGKWVLVFEGQDHPKCDVIDKYSVPVEFYQNCFESNDTLRFKN